MERVMIGRRGFLTAGTCGVVQALAGTVFGQAPPPGAEKPAGKAAAKVMRKSLRPVLPAVPSPPLKPDERVNKGLAEILNAHKLPGMIGAVVRGESVAAIGSVGVRKRGSDDRMTIGDRIHLGSDTKAITATMIGTLVEDGALSWSSTIRDVFPGRSKGLHADFQVVTLWQLLTHRAGLPANAPYWSLKGANPTEKRRELLTQVLAKAPESKPGKTYAYSNVGYIVAGLMAEQVSGMSWERLLRDRIFEPLRMASAGFGPPGSPGQLDEPWGHPASGEPGQSDNPPVLGPAGTVHCTMADWAKFVSLHLRAAEGKPKLLEAATFRMLHTPPGGSDYAAGWIVLDRAWAGGKALTHSGSNTTWYCTAWIAPLRDFAVLVATNQGGDDAAKACDEASEGLIRMALNMNRRGGRG
jgi:CubicO group peptidase (beta-lactamase class C family)